MSNSNKSFMDMVNQERDRLRTAREALLGEQQEIEDKVAGLNRELMALDAYEAAKAGKPVRGMLALPAPTKKPTTRRGRSGSKREAVLAAIQSQPGMKRGELIKKMGLTGKSEEMSVSNSITALKKAGRIRREENRYYAA